MIKIYIPSIDFMTIRKIQLFALARPFYNELGWCNDSEIKARWGIDDTYHFTNVIAEATLLLIPLPINYYVLTKQMPLLKHYHSLCEQYAIRGYGFVSGDFGVAYPEFSAFHYFRMGGFRHQLSTKNSGFPVLLSDHFKNLYGLDEPIPIQKPTIPVIGFCGHANDSPMKRGKELLKCFLENGRRFFHNPFRKDWEPLFASAYERWALLQRLEQSRELECRFIYRKKYRGGATSPEIQVQTTIEYYDNLFHSDYVVCLRGAGNFSVRFYETLLMGKIPIFVNTDCLLPLEEYIDWKKHVVWVEWNERHLIVSKVIDFHKNLNSEKFVDLQRRNRKIWKEQLKLSVYFNQIKKN